MVDNALLEQVLQLDDDSKREFIAAVELSLPEQVPPYILDEIDRRLKVMGKGLDPDAIPADQFIERIRSRRLA